MKSKNLIISILAILIVLTGGFIYLNRSYAYFYNYFGKYNLQPSTSEKIFFMPTDHSEQNIEYSYVAMGDSLTAGVGASTSAETYPYLLTQKMFTKYGPTELLNLAVSGAETKDVLLNQVSSAVAFRPDVITLLIGINDMHNRVSLVDFEKRYDEILNQLIAKPSPKIIVMSLPYLGSHISLFPYNVYFDSQTVKYNKIIKILADKYQVNYFDLYSATKADFQKNKSFYSLDLFHPSSAGYSLWVEKLSSAI